MAGRTGGLLALLRVKNQAPLWRVFAHSILVFLENDLNTSAAAISYFVMLMLFPVLVLMVSLGQVIVGGPELRHFLIDQVLALLPGTHEFVRDNLDSLERLTRGAVVSCALLVFWASSWVFTVVERALNRIWMTQPRTFLHGRAITTAMVGIAGGLLFASAFLSSGMAFLQAATEHSIHMPVGAEPVVGFIWRVAFGVASLSATVGMLVIFYKIMPNTKVYWIEAVPGAVLSGSVWEVLKYVFASILPWFVHEYRALYGEIWLALVLLTWVYISSIVMLYGAQVTALLHCERVFMRENSASHFTIERETAGVES